MVGPTKLKPSARRARLRASESGVSAGTAPAARPLPQEAVEAAVLLGQGEDGAGVAHRRLDLETVADDAGVGQRPGDLALAPARQASRIEAGEPPPVLLAAPQDGDPRQARLGAFQEQHL